jgi:Signal peptidase (SPase) II
MRARLAIIVLVATAIAGVDLAVKAVIPTEPLYFHARSLDWFVISAGLLMLALLLAQLHSRFVAFSSGVLAGGVLGNLLSAIWNRARVPNPLRVYFGNVELAFNLADVFVLAGIALAIAATLQLAIRHRDLLPQSTVAARVTRRLRRGMTGHPSPPAESRPRADRRIRWTRRCTPSDG